MSSATERYSTNPRPGTSVTVSSQTDGRHHPATVKTWTNSDESLVVSTRVAVDADVVRSLAHSRVWLSVPEGEQGFTVFGGVAQPSDATTLDITGVAIVLSEPRRQAPRAAIERPVSISSGERETRQLRSIDLSRGGVRVALRKSADLVLGEHVTVEVQLEDGTSVPAGGEVTRLDERAGEAVIRFDELQSDEGDRIDLFVLLRLASTNR